jgi:AcrR family transcriptional regulator
MDEKAQTRALILEAAGKRFRHYGYQKTTMAEIAADLSMSTGNLYRFYPSKLDIAEAHAHIHEEDEDALMADIVARPQPALERLRAFSRTVLEETFKVIDESKKVFELAQAISRERPTYAKRRLAQERIFLKRILADGVAEGVFEPASDLEFLAEMYQCATMKFRYPQLYNSFNIEMLRRELDGTLDLILTGLMRRSAS